MAEHKLNDDEERLRKLLASLELAAAADLERAVEEVLLVRRYGGQVNLRQRLLDAGLVEERQLDAIERGLHLKPAPEATGKKEPEARSYIDISRLTERAPAAGPRLGGLKLATRSASEAATDKQAQEAAAAEAGEHRRPLKSGFVPSWMKKQAVDEAAPELVEVPPELPPEAAEAEREKHIRHIIRHVVHTRLHEQILDFLVRQRMSVVEPAAVAKALGVRERDVRRVLDDLKVPGVIKDIGTHPYALSPSKQDLEDLKFFFWWWRDRDWHGRILGWLLEEEKKRGG